MIYPYNSTVLSTRTFVESCAYDATIGAGNDSEIVDFRRLQARLGRAPEEEEMRWFSDAWDSCVMEMSQP